MRDNRIQVLARSNKFKPGTVRLHRSQCDHTQPADLAHARARESPRCTRSSTHTSTLPYLKAKDSAVLMRADWMGFK